MIAHAQEPEETSYKTQTKLLQNGQRSFNMQNRRSSAGSLSIIYKNLRKNAVNRRHFCPHVYFTAVDMRREGETQTQLIRLFERCQRPLDAGIAGMSEKRCLLITANSDQSDVRKVESFLPNRTIIHCT
jgi:hypothetical protein